MEDLKVLVTEGPKCRDQHRDPDAAREPDKVACRVVTEPVPVMPVERIGSGGRGDQADQRPDDAKTHPAHPRRAAAHRHADDKPDAHKHEEVLTVARDGYSGVRSSSCGTGGEAAEHDR